MEITTVKNEVGMKWEMVKIGEIAETSSGGTPNRSVQKYWVDGSIPWIKSGQLKDCIIEEAEEFITDEGLKNSSAKFFKKGTLLLALYGATAGKLGFLGLDATTNQAICSIVPKSNNLNTKYLYYYLLSKRNEIISDSAGGAQPNISQNYVQHLQIPLPPLATQKRIAEILDAADALRRKDQALLQKYDELAQAIFMDMFGDPVKNEKGWEVKTIGEVCYYVKDGPHVSPKYTLTGIPFISVNNIIKGSIDLSNSKFISHEDFEIYSKKGKPERNDILYTKGGTTGFAKRVDVDYDFIQWVHVALLKFNQTNLNSVFFEHMLNSSFCYYQSQILTKGIANRDLVLGEIKKIKILFPPIDIQQDFEREILLIEKGKSNIVLSEKNSTNLFQTLLQKAFNGALVP
jgi:type I restriction enzyme, S subunit